MNKIKIAALIGAAFLTTGVASAADIYKSDDASLSLYGRVKAEVLNGYGYKAVSAKKDADEHPGFLGTARVGLHGESKATDFFSFYGDISYDLNAEDNIGDVNDRMKVRYGFVGARFGDYGELVAGHMEPASYRALAPVDVFDNWGIGGNGGSLDDNRTVATGSRQDGIIMYKVDDLAGFGASVSYRFRDSGDNVKNGIAAGLGYDSPFGLGAAAGYNYVEADKSTAYGDRTESLFSLYYGSYGEPGFYAAGVYDHTKLNSGDHMKDDFTSGDNSAGFKADGFDLLASYTTPKGMFTFTIDWGYLKNQWANSDKDDAVDQLSAIASWNINEQAALQIEYVDNFGDGEHSDAHQDLLSFSAIYSF